jgi:hypothetical protein
MGAEVGRLESEARGVGLYDIARVGLEPLGAEPAAGPEYRSLADAGTGQGISGDDWTVVPPRKS